MNILDRFIEAFSARDLKSRVRGVIAFGLILMAATAAGGAWFMRGTHAITVEGTAVWGDAARGILTVTISAEDLDRIPPEETLAISCLWPNRAPITSRASIIDIEPSTKAMRLQIFDINSENRFPGRFSVQLILVEQPYWKMLWGR